MSVQESQLELDHRTVLMYTHALINPLQVDEGLWADLPGAPIVPARYQTQPHLFPRLIELGRMDQHVRVDLLNRERQWVTSYGTPYFSALLLTSASTDRLHQHLIAQIDQYDPVRRDHDVIRLHDPRVWRHFRWLLRAEQWPGLLGPIHSWAWPEPDGSWRRCDRGENPGESTSRLRLSPTQWVSVLRLGELNQSLQQLTRRIPDLRDDEALAQRVNTLLAEAWNTHQMSDRTDRLLYAEQAVRFDPRIHRHPQLQERLGRVKTGENETYLGTCADLDEAAMHRMVEELNHSHRERA